MGYDESKYIYLRGNDKRSFPGGPRAGWSLVIRKADSCLLVIATHKSSDGRRVIREESVEESGRFDRDANDVRRQLTRRYGLSVEKVEAIIEKMGQCALGYRTLVDELTDPRP